MRLKKILEGVDIITQNSFKNYNIKSITHISNDVIKDSIFICIKGNYYNGCDYIDIAIKKGAKCIVTDCDVKLDNVTLIVVKDIRIAMSVMAKNFYNRCCDELDIIGIIGTSGKTTTSFLISQLLSINDNNIGIIGTNGIYIGKIKLDNKFTTPDPLELHYIFYQMKMLGVKRVIMEVSAQAISLNKLVGIKLKIGVFTNISREHLDFFGSMENYARCKMNYFNKNNMNESVVNIDDFYGRELAYKADFPSITYGINSPANSFAVNIISSINGNKFVANILDDVFNVDCIYVGLYNVYNLLASLTVAKMLGLSHSQIKEALINLKSIDGRFNVYEFDNKKIIIDFAHTPDSINKLLELVKKYAQGRVISLFGCVGYSDKNKRIEMASAVDKYSDYIIVTTDNRGETPFDDICKDIVLGIKKSKYIGIEDRKSAINFGYGMLEDNDILVLIGKGAENFQKINKDRVPYSDIDIVKEILNIKE